MHWFGDFGMGFGGSIFMILFWVLIILGVVYLIKIVLGGEAKEEKKNESAQEVLEKRYARGEISQEVFEETLKVLKRNQA